MDVDTPAGDATDSILWLANNASKLSAQQLLVELESCVSDQDEDRFLQAAKHELNENHSTKSVPIRLVESMSEEQLYHYLTTPILSPSFVWVYLFVLVIRRLIAIKSVQAAHAFKTLPPPKLLLYWEIFLRCTPSYEQGLAPTKVLNRVLAELPSPTIHALILFASHTMDPTYIASYNVFCEKILSKDRKIVSFRHHPLVDAIFSRLASLDRLKDSDLTYLFCISTNIHTYSGSALLGPADAALSNAKREARSVNDLFFDILRCNASSQEKLLRLFEKMTASDEVLTRLIKFAVERNASEQSDEKLMNLIIKLDQKQPLLDENPIQGAEKACIVDRALQVIDLLIAKFRKTFHDAGTKQIPVVAQSKFLKARSLRRKLQESSWIPLEKTLASASVNVKTKLVDFLGPPWKNGDKTARACHAHIVEAAQNYVASVPPAVFKSIDTLLHRDHLLRISKSIASLNGLDQSSLLDVPLASIQAALEPLAASGDESETCATIFAILSSLDHIQLFIPYIPENIPGLLVFVAEAANLVASMPLHKDVLSGQKPFHPFFLGKLNALKSMASCSYGFDMLCRGPIYRMLDSALHVDFWSSSSPNTTALRQQYPRDGKAFVLLWTWLRAGPSSEEIRAASAAWLTQLVFALNSDHCATIDPIALLNFATLCLGELVATLQKSSQRVWAMCALFDVLDLLHSSGLLKVTQLPAKFLESVGKSFALIWGSLHQRILQAKSDPNDPIQLHLEQFFLVLCKFGILELHSVGSVKLVFTALLEFTRTASTLSPEALEATQVDLSSSISIAISYIEALFEYLAATDSPSLDNLFAVVTQEDVVLLLLNLMVLAQADRREGLARNLFNVIASNAERLLLGDSSPSSHECLIAIIRTLPPLLVVEEHIRGATTLAFIKFVELLFNSPPLFPLLTNTSYESDIIWKTLTNLLVRDDLSDEDDARLAAWRCLKRIVVVKNRPIESLSSIVDRFDLIQCVVIKGGLRTIGGTGEYGRPFPVSTEIITICLETLQSLASHDKSLLERCLLSTAALLDAVNNNQSPGAVHLLALLQQDPKGALRRLLFFVAEILKPERKQLVETNTSLHRAIPQLISNLLSMSLELMTDQVYRIIMHITKQSCSFHSLVFFLHKFQVGDKLTKTLNTPMNFKLDQVFIDVIKSIIKKIGDGSRQTTPTKPK